MDHHILATYFSTEGKGIRTYDVESNSTELKKFPIGTPKSEMEAYADELSAKDERRDWILWSFDEMIGDNPA